MALLDSCPPASCICGVSLLFLLRMTSSFLLYFPILFRMVGLA